MKTIQGTIEASHSDCITELLEKKGDLYDQLKPMVSAQCSLRENLLQHFGPKDIAVSAEDLQLLLELAADNRNQDFLHLNAWHRVNDLFV